VLDEGQHIISEAISMVKDSISLKTVSRAVSEAGKYGFKEISNKLREAEEYYGSLLQSDGEIEAEDRLPDYEDLVIAG
jgi:Rad3-related DNA helicase